MNSAEDILAKIQEPEGYTGPKIELVLKESKMENLGSFIDTLLVSNVPVGKTIAIYMDKEEVDGELSETLLKRIDSKGYKKSEMASIMAKVNRTKIASEIANLRVASSFTEWTFKKVIKDLEGFIERDVQIKHKKIANQVERLIEENDKIAPFMQKHGIKDS